MTDDERAAKELLRFMRANSYRRDWTAADLSKLSGIAPDSISSRISELLSRRHIVEVSHPTDFVYTLSAEHWTAIRDRSAKDFGLIL